MCPCSSGSTLIWEGKSSPSISTQNFGNAIDGLIVVDLLRGEPRLLARYMGASGLAAFYAHHGCVPDNSLRAAKGDGQR